MGLLQLHNGTCFRFALKCPMACLLLSVGGSRLVMGDGVEHVKEAFKYKYVSLQREFVYQFIFKFEQLIQHKNTQFHHEFVHSCH